MSFVVSFIFVAAGVVKYSLSGEAHYTPLRYGELVASDTPDQLQGDHLVPSVPPKPQEMVDIESHGLLREPVFQEQQTPPQQTSPSLATKLS